MSGQNSSGNEQRNQDEMDEFAFRTSQKIDNLQYQLRIAADEGKNVLHEVSNQTRNFLTDVLNSSKADQLLTKRDVLVGGLGLIIGSLIGYCVAIYATPKKQNVFRCMQAVQCLSYTGIEAVSVVDDAIVPHECDPNEVLINVRSASVNSIDVKIANGYGSLIRNLLNRYRKYHKDEIPVTLGRDCTGVIVDMGSNVSRLEVGDEVWLTVPFWAPGTLAQYVITSEHNVSLKPTISFEAACSLPYAGSLALCALQEANINAENAKNKRILIHGGCTPVGCILIQILNAWGAEITTTCYRRAAAVAYALGAKDIILLSSSLLKDEISNVDNNTLLKTELENCKFDAIIITTNCELNECDFHNYCKENGAIVSTLPEVLRSDSYGFFMSALYSLQIKIKYIFQRMLAKEISTFGEAPMCYSNLDKLSKFVEEGQLRSVVDRVFHPHEIEQALIHIQSPESIGSSVISFR